MVFCSKSIENPRESLAYLFVSVSYRSALRMPSGGDERCDLLTPSTFQAASAQLKDQTGCLMSPRTVRGPPRCTFALINICFGEESGGDVDEGVA